MNIKFIKVLIIGILLLYYYAFAEEREQLVIAALGSSVTAGLTGNSQAEAELHQNDNWVDYYFTKRIKQYDIYRWLSYVSSNYSIANILTKKTKEKSESLKIMNCFNAFNEFHKMRHPYLYFVSYENILACKLYKLINDPLFYIMLQMLYAMKNNAKVILGIDMFFWIIYSKSTDELLTDSSDLNNHKKIKTLKKLLRLFDSGYYSNVNFIIGNIPQVSFVSLGANYYVDPKIVDHANNTLQEWVKNRNSSDKEKAVLIDITKIYEATKTEDTPFKLHESMPEHTSKEILNIDGLHLSFAGMYILATYIVKTLQYSDIKTFNKLGAMFDN